MSRLRELYGIYRWAGLVGLFQLFSRKKPVGAQPQPAPRPVEQRPAAPIAATEDAGAAYLREMDLRSGNAERPATTPAWALILRSPFRSWADATSWLGGVPCGPVGFVWPRGKNGDALHFLAQIDLAAVKDEPRSGARPAGLPQSGALLVFIGVKEHAVVTFSLEDMAGARPVSVPADLAPIRMLGHFSDAATFDQWPVDPVAFLDDGADRPAAFPDAWSDPAQWITTWAIAQAEAEVVLGSINHNRREMAKSQSQDPIATRPDDPGMAMRHAAHIEGRQFCFRMIESPEFTDLHATMIAWRDAVSKADPAALVDPVALEGLFILRRRLAEGIPDDKLRLLPDNRLKQLLMGQPHFLWDLIRRQNSNAIAARHFDSIPVGLRPFFEAGVTDYRGHKIFGLIKTLWYNYQDRRGQDQLICVHSDEFLRTEMEHEHAISVWCARDGLANGRYDGGQIIRHGNG